MELTQLNTSFLCTELVISYENHTKIAMTFYITASICDVTGCQSR
jgi:hypothetical protein